MIMLRTAFLIVAIVVCVACTFPLPAKFMLFGFALSIANSGLHGRSSGTVDSVAGGFIWVGIAMFIYSIVMQ